MKLCKLAIIVGCLVGNISHSTNEDPKQGILVNQEYSYNSIKLNEFRLSITSARADEPMEEVGVEGTPLPSAYGGWGGSGSNPDFDQTDGYGDNDSGGNGPEPEEEEEPPEELPPREQCLEINQQILAQCNLSAHQTYSNTLVSLCAYEGSVSVGANGVVVEANVSYDGYAVCQDIAQATLNVSTALCTATDANLTLLCPAN